MYCIFLEKKKLKQCLCKTELRVGGLEKDCGISYFSIEQSFSYLLFVNTMYILIILSYSLKPCYFKLHIQVQTY